jgi:SAM-dependent methyltransferase
VWTPPLPTLRYSPHCADNDFEQREGVVGPGCALFENRSRLSSELRRRLVMGSIDRQSHWDRVYATKRENEVSWFQETPTISLKLIRATGVTRQASIVDIGGGASRLVDALLSDGFETITVLDVSETALAAARTRLGARAAKVHWVSADATAWMPDASFDVWHDRAAFHFLTEAADRAAYAERVAIAMRPGGHVIIGTFAPDGPERCSGLPVVRHDADSLAVALGRSFQFIETRRHDHRTPAGGLQRFQFSRFRRIG